MVSANFDSQPAARRQRERRPPGLYYETRAPAAAEARELMTGVPVFVGFATIGDTALLERSGSLAVVLEGWDSRQWSGPIAEAPGSFLRAAVRGFFANEGQRCVVLALPPPDIRHQPTSLGAQRLMQALARGGPLDDRADIDLLCVPDAVGPWVADPADQRAVMAAALRHCETMADRFALLDAPSLAADARQPGALDTWLQLSSSLHSAHGALYGPWIAPDPTRDDAAAPPSGGSAEWRALSRPAPARPTGPLRFVPPCGHVAGLIARVDRRAGPQQAPANERLEGVLDTEARLSPTQRGHLNEAGINCIQGLRGHGIRVGGARTMSGHARWAYVSSVRVVLGFRRWLAVRMQDLVFEPQTPQLWATIRSRLTARCLEMQRAGALAGSQPDDAFFVKCDAETNPPEVQALGHVVAHVGLAPSIPAEFIVIRIVQDASGFTVSGLS